MVDEWYEQKKMCSRAGVNGGDGQEEGLMQTWYEPGKCQGQEYSQWPLPASTPFLCKQEGLDSGLALTLD